MRRLLYIKSETVQSSFEENRHLLQDLNINVSTLPAISFRFKNIDLLRDRLDHHSEYAGLIVTSGRSVEAIASAQSACLNSWKHLRNYCVGQTTGKKLEADLGSGWTVRGGGDTGNAELLSELMLADLRATPCVLPFLFPCSNLALGTLVTKLTSGGHKVESLEVYETVKHPELEAAVHQIAWESLDYILFFSPSTVQYFLDTLREAKWHEKLKNETLKLIAIGPSTSQEMQAQGLTVWATCTKPNIESLVEILTRDSITAAKE